MDIKSENKKHRHKKENLTLSTLVQRNAGSLVS